MNTLDVKYCEIIELSNEECKQYLNLKSSTKHQWLLGLCKSGILWGYFNHESQKWELSDAKIAENIDSELIDIRFFDENSEALLWLDDSGFRGRLLKDTINQPNSDDPLRPDSEKRILFGDRLVKCNGNFSTVADKRGAMQTLPLSCDEKDFANGRMPLRLDVKNYFARCPESGMVKNVVSRLCRISKETDNG